MKKLQIIKRIIKSYKRNNNYKIIIYMYYKIMHQNNDSLRKNNFFQTQNKTHNFSLH